MERWRPVVGYERTYIVSDLGRVQRISTGRILKCWRPIGYQWLYLQCSLSQNGINKSARVHRLVLEAFIGKIPVGKEANHKNGDHCDARLKNLEIVTRSQNAIHARHVLGLQIGSDNPCAKVIEHQVLEIRSLYKDKTAPELGRQFGLSPSAIYAIIYRRNWKHI